MSVCAVLNSAAENSCAPTREGCRACKRTGLPILPLRSAIVGTGAKAVSDKGGLPKVPTANGLRILRTGYLYVLLDNRLWQAYQVTPEGCLRQFNPFEFPRSEPEPLSPSCIAQGHDIASSFLNIDTARYTTAWVAFASDPWTRSVLDAYRTGQSPAERFVKLDLKAARANPASVGLAMTPEALKVDTEVFEYAQPSEGEFNSIHGFHSRNGKHDGLRGFVRTAMQSQQLSRGVLALVLEDPVGHVQELNATRLKWVEARATWAAQPDRAYRKLTSDCLVKLREAVRNFAEKQAEADTKTQVEEHRRWNSNQYLSAKAPLPPIDERAALQRNKERRTKDGLDSLEERYYEERRKSFIDEYDRQWRRFQEQIDQAAASYCNAIGSERFRQVDQYDYDGTVADSGIAYARTMSLCVRGGVTEQPGSDGKLPPSGASVILWKGWLNDPNSLPFQALALRHKPLLASLLPGKNANGEREWNDTQKLYDVINKLIGSKDFGEKLLYGGLKDAAAQTMSAVNSAATLLKSLLAAEFESFNTRLTVGALLLHERVHVTQLKVQMTIAGYYALQCKALREQQAKLALQAGRQTGQKVASFLTTGVLSTQLNDAALAAKTIEVTLWVEGKAQDVRKQLVNEAELLASSVVVGVNTLEPSARQVLAGVKVGVHGAAELGRRGLAGLKGAGGSAVSLLLAVGGLYLMEDSMTQNYKKLNEAIGDKHPEAMAAFAGSSLGVMGGYIEVVGLAFEAGIKGAKGAGAPVTESTLKAAARIAKAGALIGAAASGFDAMQAGMAAGRAAKAGDGSSAIGYGGSATSSGIAMVAGIAAVSNPAIFSAAFGLGPLGLAIVLSLTAYAIYKWAEGKESTPYERWARRCYFGKHNETPSVWWSSPADVDTALAGLNAVVLGMDAGVQFDDAVEIATTGTGLNPEEVMPAMLRYRFVLPGFDSGRSAYTWSLTAHRYSDSKRSADGEQGPSMGGYFSGEIVSRGEHQRPDFDTPSLHFPAGKKPRWDDYERTTTAADYRDLKNGVIRGAITLLGDMKRLNIEAATLQVTYWPDRNQPDLCAGLTVQEVR